MNRFLWLIKKSLPKHAIYPVSSGMKKAHYRTCMLEEDIRENRALLIPETGTSRRFNDIDKLDSGETASGILEK